MPGVFRRRWFPRRELRVGIAPLNNTTNLTGLEVTAQIGVPQKLSDVHPSGLQVVASSNIEFHDAPIGLVGKYVIAYPVSEDIIFPAGGGGGGAAGLNGDGEDGQDSQLDGTGGYGGSADGGTVPRQTTPGADGNAGTEFDGAIGDGSGAGGGSYDVIGQDGGNGGLYGGGGGGGGGGSSQSGLGGQGADGVVYIEYVGDLGLTKIIYYAGDTGPFVVPADWSGTNRIILVGPGGCGTAGTAFGGGNGGFGGDTIGVENTLLFNPGDVISFTIPTTPCSQEPTKFGDYQAAGGSNGDIINDPGSGGGEASVGFPGGWVASGGRGGPGGRLKALSVTPSSSVEGVEAVAEIAGFSMAGVPGPRTFWIAGIEQPPLAAGQVLFPTSEDVELTSPSYAIGSSQFYTIGQVRWDSADKIQGVDWDFVEPFTHIIQIADPMSVSTQIRLIYHRWDIGVRDGFEVTSHPVQFGFNGTSIVAEHTPPENRYFWVQYTQTRQDPNPVTMFACYPTIIDDILPNHLLYDGTSGFESYRPSGYRVYDTGLSHIYTWDGSQWGVSGTFNEGDTFYVKRKRAIYQIVSGEATVIYTAGDTITGAITETLNYPAFGESIGKNLLVDAFSGNAAIDYPESYEIALRPGLYNVWGDV